MEDPGGVEPLGARIKSPFPNHLRLERSGSACSGTAAASRPGFLIVVVMVISCFLVLPHGNDPRSSGYRPDALPLSYGRLMVLAPGLGTRECRCERHPMTISATHSSRRRLRLGRYRRTTGALIVMGTLRPMPWPLGEASIAHRVGVAAVRKQSFGAPGRT